jgi:uncharacterized membrane protein
MTSPHSLSALPALSALPDRHQLEQLARDGGLSAQGLDIALHRLGYLPDAAAWRNFGGLALLAAGSLLVLAGVVFFFAFNWDALHRFVKMALVAAPLALSAVLAARLSGQRAGQAWLGAAVVLTGVLLAVMGQIYQTGADSELLFAGWAALVLPWALAGSAPWLWLFWLGLWNVALGLYLSGVSFDAKGLFWLPLLLNAGALCVWEILWPRLGWLRAAYGPRIIAVAAAVCATVVGMKWRFFSSYESMNYTPFFYLMLYLSWLGATLWFYRDRRHDIVPLAAASLSLIVVITMELFRWLIEYFSKDYLFSLLLLGLAVAAMTALAAAWLRRTVQAWQRPVSALGAAREQEA